MVRSAVATRRKREKACAKAKDVRFVLRRRRYVLARIVKRRSVRGFPDFSSTARRTWGSHRLISFFFFFFLFPPFLSTAGRNKLARSVRIRGSRLADDRSPTSSHRDGGRDGPESRDGKGANPISTLAPGDPCSDLPPVRRPHFYPLRPSRGA